MHPDEAFVLFNRLAVQRLLAFAAAQAPPWPPLLPPSTLAKALPFLAQHCRATGVDLVQLNLFEVVHVSGHLPDPASVFGRRGIGVCDRFVFYHWPELESSAARRNFTGSTRLYQPFAFGTPTYMLPRRKLCQPGRLHDVYPPGSLLGWAPPTNRFASGGWPARPPMALDAGSDRGLKVGCDHTSSVCDADGNEPTQLVFLHIPKAAGTSALSDLRDRGYQTSKFSQAEPCLRDVHCPSQGAIHFTLLRSPRDHILSQYHMCRDSEWGRLHARALPATFEAWLDHFLAPNASRLDAFNCYNPWNMQARALTCSVSKEAGLGRIWGSDDCEKWLALTFGQKCELWGSELHRPTRMAALEPRVPSALSSLDSMVQLAGELLHGACRVVARIDKHVHAPSSPPSTVFHDTQLPRLLTPHHVHGAMHRGRGAIR